MAKDLRDSGREAGIDHGRRRMTYKEMHAAARRAIKIIADNGELTTDTAYALTQDPEAAVEYAAALGKLDESERGIAEGGSRESWENGNDRRGVRPRPQYR